jgi:hypothetical protein
MNEGRDAGVVGGGGGAAGEDMGTGDRDESWVT